MEEENDSFFETNEESSRKIIFQNEERQLEAEFSKV